LRFIPEKAQNCYRNINRQKSAVCGPGMLLSGAGEEPPANVICTGWVFTRARHHRMRMIGDHGLPVSSLPQGYGAVSVN